MFSINSLELIKISIPVLQSMMYSYDGSISQEMSERQLIQIINQLSQDQVQEFITSISHIYQCEYSVIQKHIEQLQNSPSKLKNESASDSSQKYAVKKKKTTEKVVQNSQILREALIIVLESMSISINPLISDKDLALLTNKAVNHDSRLQFWNLVAAQIPNKSKKQLYDFYHNSFSKALFELNFTSNDKRIIFQINKKNPELKPAQLAEIFLQKTGRNFLKRDVIMQFVSLRRQELSFSE
ncbi:Hypothetical_protein [Hexamita inflata]|uniref:Hypothetical_protein n=1 Tax=Hexamita inflata TaxID=28002 RepID=A0AA86RFV1_9EUKA|nr:Hypothetical protein HINF_LOCUS64866 [Hexamita inflata]